MSLTRKIGVVFLILAIVWSMIIWSFSLKNAENSSVDSNAAKSALESILEFFFGEDVELGDKMIRKLAHFCEFAALGFLTFMTFYCFEHRKRIELISYPTLWGLGVAGTDEFLQLFFEGRSAQLTDVLLDVSGVLVAALFMWMIVMITNKKSRP